MKEAIKNVLSALEGCYMKNHFPIIKLSKNWISSLALEDRLVIVDLASDYF
jgi:hypothetical protein